MTNKNDMEIIALVLEGDVDLFSVLIDRYGERIFKIVSLHIPADNVEEVANDIFFKAYKSLKTFKNDSPFINWLSVISIRACKDYWRASYAKRDMPMSSFDEEYEKTIDMGTDERTPEDTLLNEESRNMLLAAMDRLKPAERTVINMLYAEERSVAEAAALTGMTESNIKVTAFRARKKLADILNGMN
ncbi:MAG: RNA polymerase sigma factor [Mucispirillum sp.]|nr:RNA polymerase sigma factor [Mucispirillum sp.]